MQYLNLHTGNKIPVIGMGTSANSSSPDFLASAIVDFGYRMIDTASYYKNEEMVGDAVQLATEKGVSRENLFITTKVSKDKHDKVIEECKASLRKLKLDYIDLYLVHFPYNSYDKQTKARKRIPMYKIWADMES